MLESLGRNWNCRWAGLLALDVGLFCKNKKQRGSAGSLGWTWTDAGLGWSEGSGRGTPLQKEQERRRAGRGFARGRSDA